MYNLEHFLFNSEKSMWLKILIDFNNNDKINIKLFIMLILGYMNKH